MPHFLCGMKLVSNKMPSHTFCLAHHPDFINALVLPLSTLSAVVQIKWYIYIYIYIHPFTKTLLFQKYISHICINAEKRLKQGGHTLHQPRGVAITCNFFFRYAYMYFLVLTKKIPAQKRYNDIYDIHVLK